MPIAEALAVAITAEIGLRSYEWFSNKIYEKNIPLEVANDITDGTEFSATDLRVAFGESFSDPNKYDLTLDREEIIEQTACELADETESKEDCIELVQDFLRELEIQLSHQEELGQKILIRYTQEITDHLVNIESLIEDRELLEPYNDLAKSGFKEISPHFFSKNPPSNDPIDGWYLGFSLSDVDAGYALERQAEKNGERVSVTADVISLLKGGNNIVITGPPGSGKSTICKSVACSWNEQDNGTILYHESGTMYDSINPHDIKSFLEKSTQEILIIIEDITEENTSDLFSMIDEIESNPDINAHFLFDSQAGSWNDDSHMFDPRSEKLKRKSITQYTVPPIDPEEIERAHQKIESLSNEKVHTLSERAYSEITNARRGKMHLLSYFLSHQFFFPEASDLSGPSSSLQSHVKYVYNHICEFPSEIVSRDQVFRVAVAINLLNASRVKAHPEFIFGLVDKSRYSEIENILENLEGRLIFSKNRKESLPIDGSPYSTFSKSWSISFLQYFLEEKGRQEASRIAASVINSIFDLPGNEEKIDHIEQHMLGKRNHISELLRNRVSETSDSLVGDLYGLGDLQGGIAYLFGSSEYSAIQMPENVSTSAEMNAIYQHGRLFLGDSEFREARAIFKRLRDESTSSNDLSPEDEERYRVLGLVGEGCIYVALQKWENAINILTKSNQIITKNLDNELQCSIYMNLSEAYKEIGEYQESDYYARKAYKIYKEHQDMSGIGECLITTAIIAIKRLQDHDFHCSMYESWCYLKSAEHFLSMSRDLPTEDRVDAHYYYCMAAVEQEWGNLGEAANFSNIYGNIMSDMGNRLGKCHALYQTGSILLEEYRQSGRPEAAEEAKDYYRECIGLANSIGFHNLKLKAKGQIGMISQLQGDSEQALKSYSNILPKFSDQHEADMLPFLINYLNLLIDENDIDQEIEEKLTSGKRIAKENGHINIYREFMNIEWQWVQMENN